MAEDTAPLGRSRAGVLDVLLAADAPSRGPGSRRSSWGCIRTQRGSTWRRWWTRAWPSEKRKNAIRRAGLGSVIWRLPKVPQGSAATGYSRRCSPASSPGLCQTRSRPAAEAGREWGAYLTEQPQPYQRLTAAEAIEKLTATMTGLGFAPHVETVTGGGEYQLCLRQCPFREVARKYQGVICTLHLGLMRGALARDARAGHRRRPGTIRGTQLVHRPPGGSRRV